MYGSRSLARSHARTHARAHVTHPSQAVGAALVFGPLAAAWAAASTGSLDDSDGPPGEPAPPPPAGAELLPPAGLLRRGLLKAPARAVEKALTCYGGDVSRLGDVCRCRIAFDGLPELLRCAEIVAAAAAAAAAGEGGGGVRVARVKDRLGGAGPADGFRVSRGCDAGDGERGRKF